MKKKNIIIIALILLIILIALFFILKKDNNGSAKVIEEKDYSWVDNDSDGKKGVEDEIIVNGEEFYIISNKDGVIRALAKYNLMIGNKVEHYDKNTASEKKVSKLDNPTGLQDKKALGCIKEESTCYGSIELSESIGWEEDENITVDLIEGSVHDDLVKYQDKVGYPVSLITKDDLENLGCDFKTKKCSNKKEWVYSTAYWTGVPYEDDRVWSVNRKNELTNIYTIDNDYPFGIRPVITIGSKTENKENKTEHATTTAKNDYKLELNKIYYDQEEKDFEKNSKPIILEDELGEEYTSEGIVSYITFKEDNKVETVINNCMGFEKKNVSYKHYIKDGKEIVELNGFYDENVLIEVTSSKELKIVSGSYDCGSVSNFKLYE